VSWYAVDALAQICFSRTVILDIIYRENGQILPRLQIIQLLDHVEEILPLLIDEPEVILVLDMHDEFG
jgi:hypothetical protein